MSIFSTAVAVSLTLGVVGVPAGAAATTEATPCPAEAVLLPAGAVAGSIGATDPTGRYQVGEYRGADGQDRFALWLDGTPAEVVLGDGAAPADVNARGEVVGNTNPGDGGWRGWRRKGGQLVSLPVPAGAARAEAVAINARGEVAGQATNGDGWDSRAVVWPVTGAARTLALPPGFNEARAAGIDDDGTVVGTVSDWDYENATVRSSRAVAWFPEGGWRFLPGTGDDALVEAAAIRHGAVTGREFDPATRTYTAVSWATRSGGATVVAPGASPSDLSTNGSVLLRSGVQNLLQQAGEGRTLTQRDPVMGSGRTAGVTDDELVYGSDTDAGGAEKPVRWRC